MGLNWRCGRAGTADHRPPERYGWRARWSFVSVRSCASRTAVTDPTCFPIPAVFAGVDPASLGMPKSRGVALLAVAAAVVADPHIFAAGRSLEEAVAQLRALPGIGEWTAQYIAMRQLREPDAFPAADIGLMRAMANSEGVRPTASALLARAETWRPWRAYAAQHLWASA